MSDMPEFRLLSTNACPNAPQGFAAGGRFIEEHAGLTTYGYCSVCWERGLVPPAWRTRVEDDIERRNAPC